MSVAEGTALTERQRYWLEHVQVCAASGEIIAEYAAEHNLAAQAMYAGKKILIKKAAYCHPRARHGFRGHRWWLRLPVASGAFIYRTVYPLHFPVRWMRRH